MKDITPGPQWLKDRMDNIKNQPAPTLEEVEAQFRASFKTQIEILEKEKRDNDRLQELFRRKRTNLKWRHDPGCHFWSTFEEMGLDYSESEGIKKSKNVVVMNGPWHVEILGVTDCFGNPFEKNAPHYWVLRGTPEQSFYQFWDRKYGDIMMYNLYYRGKYR